MKSKKLHRFKDRTSRWIKRVRYRIRPDGRDERACRYVSSHGLMKSCHRVSQLDDRWKSPQLPEQQKHNRIAGARSLYVNTWHVDTFTKEFLDRIEQPFTLVTGDCDLTVGPEDFATDTLDRILGHPHLVQWFAQNCGYDHAKLHPMPLGLDYHSMSRKRGHGTWGKFHEPVLQEQILDATRLGASKLEDKIPAAFCNWHHALNRGDRLECIRSLSLNTIRLEGPNTPRAETWRNNAQYLFTASPLGTGVDCHRTWEALLLGTIPIIKSSGIDLLFSNLPVCIVKDWSEVTPAYLAQQRQLILQSTFDFSTLYLADWIDRINGRKPILRRRQRFQEFIDAGLSDVCNDNAAVPTTGERFH